MGKVFHFHGHYLHRLLKIKIVQCVELKYLSVSAVKEAQQLYQQIVQGVC